MTLPPPAPLPVFDGIFNFRDIGGYRGADGAIVRHGQVYRSAGLDQASDNDLERFLDLNVAQIIDLRAGAERRAAPSRRHPSCPAQVIELEDAEERPAPHERYLGGDDLSKDVLIGRALEFYRNAPSDVRLVPLFRQGLQAVASAQGPTLIHCAAGKDRTGIMISLIQHILGMHRDDIIAEYLLTNEDARLIDYLTDRAAKAVADMGKTVPRENLMVVTGVRPEYLERTWATMDEQHNGIHGYLASLGIDDAARQRIRARLLR